MMLLPNLHHLLRTLLEVLYGQGSFLFWSAMPKSFQAARILCLTKELEVLRERKVKPRRLTDGARFTEGARHEC